MRICLKLEKLIIRSAAECWKRSGKEMNLRLAWMTHFHDSFHRARSVRFSLSVNRGTPRGSIICRISNVDQEDETLTDCTFSKKNELELTNFSGRSAVSRSALCSARHFL